MSGTLPKFTTHTDDTKNYPIDVPITPPEFVLRYLNRELESRGRTAGEVRVLDVGCGRGDTVAWLLNQGWDAYGVDVAADYISRGRDYLRSLPGADPDRLQVIDPDSPYPFPDASFDIVLSDQVIEHVEDLDRFVIEVARISAPGAAGMHIFPAKWRPVETHLLMPFVHWLPKGPLRRRAIGRLIRADVGVGYFADLLLDDRTAIYSAFSEDETFYRPLRDIVETFRRQGLRCDSRSASREKIAFHLAGSPKAAVPLLGWLYRNFASVVLYTRKP